ncbi:hypothetical protein Q7P37_009557 [Cladosporium fusiforme]
MAEAAGLAVGAIALASLFTTCIELLDYFELGQRYEDDYDLACTKINLLQARLSTWGQVTQIQEPGREHPSLRDPSNRIAVSSSLITLRTILSNTDDLRKKYEFFQEKHGFAKRPCRPQRPAFLSLSLRRRTTWSIRDKGKFDRFIVDMNFLVENIEKVTECTTRTRFVPDEQQVVGGGGTAPDSKTLAPKASMNMHPDAAPQALLYASKSFSHGDDTAPSPGTPTQPGSRAGVFVEEAIASALKNSQIGSYIFGDHQTNRGPFAFQGVLDPPKGVTTVVQASTQVNEDKTIAFQGMASAEALARLHLAVCEGKAMMAGKK